MAIDGQGQQMVTAGADGQVKVWDCRKFQAMHAYFSHAPVEALDISQRGLLAVGYGRNVQVPSRLLLACPFLLLLQVQGHCMPTEALYISQHVFLAVGYGRTVQVTSFCDVSTLLLFPAGQPHLQGQKRQRDCMPIAKLHMTAYVQQIRIGWLAHCQALGCAPSLSFVANEM